VHAYEIHHGSATAAGDGEPFLDGWRRGQTWGTMWHGAWENDEFRRSWLTGIAEVTGSRWRADPSAPAFSARRETMIDQLADAIAEHVDVDMVLGSRLAQARRP
jgi:adenosylcobyric acid synthase